MSEQTYPDSVGITRGPEALGGMTGGAFFLPFCAAFFVLRPGAGGAFCPAPARAAPPAEPSVGKA